MLKADLNSYKKWFSNYVSNFYGGSEYVNANLELKEIHTGCVISQAGYIANGIGLGENDSLIAETVALFHDGGRYIARTMQMKDKKWKSRGKDIELIVLDDKPGFGGLDRNNTETFIYNKSLKRFEIRIVRKGFSVPLRMPMVQIPENSLDDPAYMPAEMVLIGIPAKH